MDAYEWSNPVGAGRTDHKRPRLQRRETIQAHTAPHPTKRECDSKYNELLEQIKLYFGYITKY